MKETIIAVVQCILILTMTGLFTWLISRPPKRNYNGPAPKDRKPMPPSPASPKSDYGKPENGQ
jgi:hypothetical protein